MKQINIGCGNDYRDGYVNIDKNNEARCDVAMDLETDKFPFEDNSIDYAVANHVIEHITNLTHLMNEVHRVLKPGAIFHIEVPVANSISHWKDPTHVRGFVEQTFKYFTNWNTCPFYGVNTWAAINKLQRHTDVLTDENSYIVCELVK